LKAPARLKKKPLMSIAIITVMGRMITATATTMITATLIRIIIRMITTTRITGTKAKR
jgi:hypothetical protein